MSNHDDNPSPPVETPATADAVPELTEDQLESVSGGRTLGVSDSVQKLAPKRTSSWLAQEPGGQGLDD